MDCLYRGTKFIVPGPADYEIRRELLRLNKVKSLQRLDELLDGVARLYPLEQHDLREAAELWARMRNTGHVTADDKDLDCDVIIAAQVRRMPPNPNPYIVVTDNLRHFTKMCVAERWRSLPIGTY